MKLGIGAFYTLKLLPNGLRFIESKEQDLVVSHVIHNVLSAWTGLLDYEPNRYGPSR